jgi:hypothetical protein
VILTVLRKFQSAKGLSLFVLLWFPVIWLGLGILRMAILAFSFKKLSFFFGSFDGINEAIPLLPDVKLNRAIQIKKLVAVAANNTPWVSNCFPQAIAARLLLGIYRVPYALYFGLCRKGDDNALKAHAWVCSGPCAVSGGLSFDDYKVVGCYGSQSWRAKANQ